MNVRKTTLAIALAAAALATSAANAAQTVTSAKFTYDYMATNLKGNFATASGGTAGPVAELTLTDLAGGAGVRATFHVLDNGLSQFSNGTGFIFISAFETNFPGTSACGNATCSSTGEINGYDSDANGGLGNQWANVSGVPLTGGIEWAENGATNGWGSGTTDPSFQQENNWGNGTAAGGVMTQTSGDTVFDFLNAPGQSNISVQSLLGNPVANSVDGTLPVAYSWIKIRSNATATAGDRGIATDQWWGTPATSGAGANQRWQLNVLATNYTVLAAVPEPSEYALMGVGLFGVAWAARRRKARRAA